MVVAVWQQQLAFIIKMQKNMA